MKHIDVTSRFLKGVGIEIGAHTHPIEGISPIYVDRMAMFAGQPDAVRPEICAKADDLPFYDNSLDYVASSHVLEHLASPIAALREWYRVIRPGGHIYMVVPDRRFTFDHTRELTTVDHIFEDFSRGVTDCDATHIDEHMDEIDWSRWRPDLPAEGVPAERENLRRAYQTRVERGEDIFFHFHVFEPSTVVELVERLASEPTDPLRWELVFSAERFPADRGDGFLTVIEVRKEDADQAAYERSMILERPQGWPVLPTARRFSA